MKSFTKRVQSTPAMKSIKKRIKANEAARKKLSGEYKRTLTRESRRLGKKRRK